MLGVVIHTEFEPYIFISSVCVCVRATVFVCMYFVPSCFYDHTNGKPMSKCAAPWSVILRDEAILNRISWFSTLTHFTGKPGTLVFLIVKRTYKPEDAACFLPLLPSHLPSKQHGSFCCCFLSLSFVLSHSFSWSFSFSCFLTTFSQRQKTLAF